LTVLSGIGRDGKVICFKSLKHGLESYGLGSRTVPFHHSDVEIIDTGIHIRTQPSENLKG